MFSVRRNNFASTQKQNLQGRGSLSGMMAMLALSMNLSSLTMQPGHAAPMNLDLSSTHRSVAPPASLGTRTVGITTGGTSRQVNSQNLLTPAERVAVWQVLTTGQQAIKIGAQGNAVGGSFNISPRFNSEISNLVIPKGVNSYSAAPNLNIVGNLNNSGIMQIQPVQNVLSSINASNIINNAGALITSTSPLSLIASNNILNYGQIISGGTLELVAGNSIVNAASTSSALSGILSATNNLNLSSPNIINSGLISAANGNINISSLIASNIIFNNTNGTLSALKGDLNVRDALFTDKVNFNLFGGDILSKNLNLWSGCGNIDVDVNDATGIINASAGNIHILTNTPDLHLGKIVFLDDPTFFNSGGSISVNSALTAGLGAIALVATGDITGGVGGSISTGGNALLVVAGANFSVNPPISSGLPNTGGNTTTGQGTGDISSIITLQGPSASGGKIDFSAITVDSSSPVNGGNITMAAFGGTSTSSGIVNLGNITTNTTTSGISVNGNVTIIAGAKNDPTGSTVINTGSITTDTQGAVGGSVTLVTGQPNITGGSFQVFKGLVQGGSATASLGTAGTSPNASITTLAITAGGAPVFIVAGNNVNLNGNIQTAGIPSSGLTGPGGNVTIFAGGNIQTSSSSGTIVTSPGTNNNNAGGEILLAAGVNAQVNVNHTFTNSGVTDVIVATANVAAASATGGSINLPGFTSINSQAGTSGPDGGAAGGNVTLVAMPGSSSSSGNIFLPAVNIQSGGAAITGSTNPGTTNIVNGNVSIFAGAPSGNSISVGALSLSANSNNSTSLFVSNTTGLPIGAQVFGAGIPASTTVSTINSASVGFVGTTTLNSTTVKVSNTTGLTKNQPISGPGIPAGATITSINTNASIVISAKASATVSNASLIQFGQVTLNNTVSGTTNNIAITTQAGGINTAGGNQGGGSINVQTASATAGLPFSYSYNGGATANSVTRSGSFSPASKLQPASIALGNLTAQGGSLPIPAPSLGLQATLTTDILVKSGNDLALGAVSNPNGTLPVNGVPVRPSSSIDLQAAGVMTLNGSISSNAVSPAITVTGTISNGSSVVTNILSTAGLVSGTVVTDDGSPGLFPAGTAILPDIQLTPVTETNGNTIVTIPQDIYDQMNANPSFYLNLPVAGTGIAPGTTLAAIGPTSQQITLSQNSNCGSNCSGLSISLLFLVPNEQFAGTANATSSISVSSVVAAQLANDSGAIGQPVNINGTPSGQTLVSVSGNTVTLSGAISNTGAVVVNVLGSMQLSNNASSAASTLNNYAYFGADGGTVSLKAASYNTPSGVSVNANGSNGFLPATTVPYFFQSTMTNNSITGNAVPTAISGLVVGTQVATSPTNTSFIPANTFITGTTSGTFTMTNQFLGSTGTYNLVNFIPRDSGGGNGGSVSISSSNPSNGTITVGSNNLSISALGDTAGGNGGKVTLNSASNIVLNPANLTAQPTTNFLQTSGFATLAATGNGAIINLIAATTAFISGTLDASGAASSYLSSSATTGNPGGNGGSIKISVNSSLPFVIGGASTGGNGVATGGILSANGNIIGVGADTAALGNAGTIAVENKAGAVVVLNSLTGAPVAFTASVSSGSNVIKSTTIPGNVAVGSVIVGPGIPAGAIVTAVSPGVSITINQKASASSPSAALQDVGDPVSFAAGVTAGSNSIIVSSASGLSVGGVVLGPNFQAGTIITGIKGTTITVNNNAFLTSSDTMVYLGMAAVQAQAAPATPSPYGAPGNQPAYLGGQGGNISLKGTSVWVYGALDASGGAVSNIMGSGSGGSVAITTNSTSSFIVNPATTGGSASNPLVTNNGVIGSISANGFAGTALSIGAPLTTMTSTGSGGSLSLINNGGGVTIGLGAGLSVIAANASALLGVPGGDGGTIILNANGPLQSFIPLSADGGASAVVNYPVNTVTAGTNVSITMIGSSTVGLYSGQEISIFQIGGPEEALSISSVTAGASITVYTVVNNYPGSPSIQGFFPAGDGGTIKLTSNVAGTTPFTINPSTVSNSNSINGIVQSGFGLGYTISASGYSGGSISITNNGASGISIAQANSINVATNKPSSISVKLLSFGGYGGNIALQAPKGPVAVAGNLSVSGMTGASSGLVDPNIGGNGGNIFITSNSSTLPFLIGASSVNGIAGNISASGGVGPGGAGDAGSITVVSLGAKGIQINSGVLSIQPGSTPDGGSPGNGGTLVLSAPKGAVVVDDSIDLSGGLPASTSGGYSQGLGGSVTIVSNSNAADFSVGSGTLPANGVTNSIAANGWSGGSISLSNLGSKGISVASAGLSVTAAAADSSVTQLSHDVGGNGGNISLNAPNGQVAISGGLDASGGANDGVSLPGGSGGQIAILTGSTKAFNVGGATPSSTNGTTGALTANGGNINFALNPSLTNAFPGVVGGGGVVNITATNGGDIIVTPGPVGGSPNISVSGYPGVGSFAGGTSGSIFLQANGTNGFVYITGSSHTFTGNPNGSTTIAVKNTIGLAPGTTIAGNGVLPNTTITQVNASSIEVSNPVPTGTNVQFTQTGTGGLIVDGGAVGSGPQPGSGGQISIISNTSTPFVVGNAAVGTNGTGSTSPLSAQGYNGGIIAIKNLGSGGINFNPGLIKVSSALGATGDVSDFPAGNGGVIDLQAANGTLQATATGTLRADGTAATGQSGLPDSGNGGMITLLAAIINTATTPIKLSAVGANTSGYLGQGGYISITQTKSSAQSLTVGLNQQIQIAVNGSPSASLGGTISLVSASGISVSGNLSTDASSSTGSISLTTGSKFGISQTGPSISTGTLNLNTGSGGTGTTGLNTTVANLSVQSNGGNVNVSNSVSLTINSAVLTNSTTTNSLSFGVTAGNLTVQGAGISSSNGITLSANDSAASSGNVLINSNVIAKTVSISASGDGSSGGSINGTGIVSAKDSITLSPEIDGIGSLTTATGQLVVTANNSTSISVNNTGDVLLLLNNASSVGTVVLNNSGSVTVLGSSSGGMEVSNLTINNAAANSSSSVTLLGTVGAASSTSSVTINAGGSIVQQGGSIISANAVTLSSQNGNIGMTTRAITLNGASQIYTPGGTPILVDLANNGSPGTLSLSTQNSTDNSNPGTVNVLVLSANTMPASSISSDGSVNVTALSAGGDALITTNMSDSSATMTLSGAASSTFGAISLLNNNSSNGVMSIQANMTAAGGPLTLQNNNSVSSSIEVADGVALSGVGWFFNGTAAGNVVNNLAGVALINGAFPATLAQSDSPSTVTVAGQVFLGSTNGSATVTVPITTGLILGSTVTGNGIPQNTTITAIVPNTSITLSNAASGTNSNIALTANSGGSIAFTGTASNSTMLTGVSSTSGLAVGATLTGSGIPAQTVIVSISGSTITVNNTIAGTSSVSVSATDGVSFGSSGTLTAAATADINASGATVAFQGGTSGAIVLGASGNVTINAGLSALVISSLDLTSSNVVNNLNTLNGNSNSGVTTNNFSKSGGSVTFNMDPSVAATPLSLANLSSMEIPSATTVNFLNFNKLNPIAVNVNSTSTAANVTISGSIAFNGQNNAGVANAFNSDARIFFNSIAAGGQIGTTATGTTLSSDNSLIINAGGSLTLAGTISAGSNGLLNIFAGQACPATTKFTATSLPSGTITLSALTLSAGSANNSASINLAASNFAGSGASSITASSVSLSAGGSNWVIQGTAPLKIASSKISGIPIISANLLTLNAGTGATVDLATGVSSSFNVANFVVNAKDSSVSLSQSGPLTIASPSLSFTGNLSFGTDLIDNISNTSGLNVGAPVSGAGIPAGSSILQVVANVPFSGQVTLNNSVVTGITDTSALQQGMTITGPGIQPGTTISAPPTSSTITLSLVPTLGNGSFVSLNQQGTATVNNTATDTTASSSLQATTGSASLGTLKVSSSGASGSISTSANLTCGSCTLTSTSIRNFNTIYATLPQGTISVGAPSTMPLTITGVDSTGLQEGLMIANNGLSITSPAALTLIGGTLSTQSGALSLTNTGTTNISISAVNLNAGSLVAFPNLSGGPNTLPGDVATTGSVNVTSKGDLKISESSSFQSVGNNVNLSSKGKMSLQGSFTANGGSIVISATGKTLDATNSTFTVSALGTTATNAEGGGISVSAGVSGFIPTLSGLIPGQVPASPYFEQPGQNVPQILGSNIEINNAGNVTFGFAYPTGALVTNLGTGSTVNVGNSNTSASQVFLTGGAMFLNTGNGASILMDTAIFNINGFSPIAAVSKTERGLEYEIDDLDNAELTQIANVFVHGQKKSLMLTNRGILSKTSNTVLAAKENSELYLRSGSAFINPICNTTIHTEVADVKAKKGALISICVEHDGLRVIACSGPGHVVVEAGGKEIALTAGEEILISDHVIAQNEHGKSDGVGRRDFTAVQLGAGLHGTMCDVSIFSLLSNAKHLSALRRPGSDLERGILSSMLKTAAALSLVTSNHGAYKARPLHEEDFERAASFVPVRYLSMNAR